MSRKSIFSCRVKQLTVLFLVLGVLTMPQFAESQERLRYSETEKVGFAFYHLSKGQPNFESWIKETEAYRKASPAGKVKLLQNETARLEQGFVDANYGDDIIHVSTSAVVHYGNARGNKDEDISKIVVDFSDKPGPPYFPFPLGDSWVAIVSNDLENHKLIDMEDNEYALARKSASKTKKQNFKATADLELYFRPRKAGSKEPYKLDGVDVWLLMCDLVSVEIWLSGHRGLIWKYDAPGYVPETTSKVMQLYGQ